MSIDSTKLTFVRCPSCKSLVPAISSRCRMCGAALAAPEEKEPEDDGKKSGRVRQRTMSQPQSELKEAADQLRQTSSEEPPPAPRGTNGRGQNAAADEPGQEPQPMEQEDAEENFDDPLSAYIEEVEEEAQAEAEAEPEPEPEAPEQTPPPRPEKAAAAPSGGRLSFAARAVADIPPLLDDSVEEEVEILEEHEPEPKPVFEPPAKPQAAEPPPAPEKPAPRVVVESGGRRFNKGGLSFGKSAEARGRDGGPARAAEARAPEPKPEPRPAEPKPAAAAPALEAKSPPAAEEFEEYEEENADLGSDAPQEEARPAPQPRISDVQPRQDKGAPGRLLGWLVSYADPDGSAIELREGKFFVTASSLKGRDLVINDKSVSTPHALVTVSAASGVQLQDLMSDRGVFARKRGRDTYQREESTIRAEHGDWVRFGDVEFLVTLIAHVGEK